MNPSTAQATVVVDELVRGGLRHVVVCPGSRNAPLSIAFHAAAVAGRLTLHVRIDERSAAFLALGIARGLDDGFAAVVCTSGTAVANLHPATLEALHARVPLLLLTADRPGDLVGTGANQTVRQHGIFGPDVSVVDLPLAERIPGRNPIWRGTICRALAMAADGGPVQLNMPLREPLVPTDAPPWPDALDGRPDGAPWTRRLTATTTITEPVHLPARTVVVLGDGPHAAEAAELATAAGWPVIAEPMAHGGKPLPHGALLLAAGITDRLAPEAVLAVGRPTLSRGVQRLLGSAPRVHVVDGPEWTDPQRVATTVATALAVVADDTDEGWVQAWRDAASQAADAVESVLSQAKWPTGLQVARDLVATLPAGSVLFAGSSNPVRDLDFAAEPRADVHVYANRGVAGIDGSVSSALGVALGTGRRGYALIGDLTFLHDSGGLLVGPGEPRPDVTIVVLNDDGGGIFTLLEQGAPEHADSFERVFGTPHGTDLAALCAAHGVPHMLAEDPEMFRAALAPAPGIRVVEVRADRSVLRDLHARLRAEVHDRITG